MMIGKHVSKYSRYGMLNNSGIKVRFYNCIDIEYAYLCCRDIAYLNPLISLM